MGWMVDEFVVGQIEAKEKINPRLLPSKSWSASDDPPKADTGADGENTHSAQAARLSLHTLSPVAFTAIFVSPDFCSCFSAHSNSGFLLCAFAAQTFLALGDCDRSTRKGKSLWVSMPHSYTANITHSVVLWLQTTNTCYSFWAQVQIQWLAESYIRETAKPRKLLQEEISQKVWWAVHSQHFRYLQISFTTLWQLRIRRPCKWNLFAGGNSVHMHCLDQEDMKSIFSEILRNSAANSKSWRKTLVTCLCCQNQQFQVAVREYLRQEIPSIRLRRNLQKIMKFWWCKKFKVSRIDMDEWRKM